MVFCARQADVDDRNEKDDRTLSVGGGRRSDGSCSSSPAAALLNFLTMRASSGNCLEEPGTFPGFSWS